MDKVTIRYGLRSEDSTEITEAFEGWTPETLREWWPDAKIYSRKIIVTDWEEV